jgi:hypothetical protein
MSLNIRPPFQGLGFGRILPAPLGRVIIRSPFQGWFEIIELYYDFKIKKMNIHKNKNFRKRLQFVIVYKIKIAFKWAA